ncbi:MAG: alanyl-tRNA editing protein [Candidatus Aramenus sp.]|nr:alanyl-tRNA editing protein [Candidatus Aramenus sp.]
MTEELFLKDSYVREFEAMVVKSTEEGVVLDKTAFYPGGGGLENDVGKLIFEGKEYKVTEVKRKDGEIVHKVEEKVPEGAVIKGVIDWERRYAMMRLHTASHIISAIAFSKYNAMVTGGSITPEYAKDDFNVEDKSVLAEIVREANEVAKKGIEVKVYFLPREEAMMIPGIVKLMGRNPPEVPVWRIVEIPGVDIQADGGPHVKNTREIGEIQILKVENRGKGRKRVYYTVKTTQT